MGVVRGAHGGEWPVHFSDVEGDGFKTLAEGEEVEFDVVADSGRPKASRVRRVSQD